MTPHFDGSETIADILLKLPEASEILASHGLSCASCHLNQEEPLREGVLGHGFSEDAVSRILEDLNEAAEESDTYTPDKKKGSNVITLSKAAADAIITLQKEQNTQGQGLKIEAEKDSDGEHFFLDFAEKPEPEDRVICSEDIKLYVDPESLKLLKGKRIDYKKTGNEEGFIFLDQ